MDLVVVVVLGSVEVVVISSTVIGSGESIRSSDSITFTSPLAAFSLMTIPFFFFFIFLALYIGLVSP